jgi:hypothetical protein
MKNFKKSLLAMFPLILAPCTFFLFAPMEMVMRNAPVLWFTWQDVFPIIIVAFLAAVLLFCLIGLVLPEKIRRYYIALIWGVGLALYVQGNLIPVDYGPLDGTPVDWEQFAVWAVINTVIWIVLIVAPILAVRFWRVISLKVMMYATFVLLVVQIGTVTIVAAAEPPDQGIQRLIVTPELNHTVSDNRNILVFILDSFDVVHMNTLLEEEPGLAYLFDGFIFFDNVLSKFNYTIVGGPVIYTGMPFRNETLYQEYLDIAWTQAPLYPMLRQQNFITNLYINELISPLVIDLIDNVHFVDGWVIADTPGMFGSLYRFVGVRYFPHLLKAPIWMHMSDFELHRESVHGEIGRLAPPETDFRFYNTLMDEGLAVVGDKNMFSMFHLWAMHVPVFYDRNVQPAVAGVTTIFDQARGALQIVLDYIEHMKELGVYNDTLVVITTDHGQFENRQATAMLVREPFAIGPMVTSSLPLSKIDVMPMLVSFVEYGTSPMEFFQSVTEGRETRIFYMVSHETVRAIGNRTLGTGDIHMFEFGTESTRRDDGRHVGIHPAILHHTLDSLPEIRLNRTVDFRLHPIQFFAPNNVRQIAGGMASVRENLNFRASVLDMPASTDLWLELVFNVMSECPEYRRQRIRIYVNEHFIDERTYHMRQQNIIDVLNVPHALLNDDGSLFVRFEFLDALEFIHRGGNVMLDTISAITLQEITLHTEESLAARVPRELNPGSAPPDFSPPDYNMGEVIRLGEGQDGRFYFNCRVRNLTGRATAIGYRSIFGVMFNESVTSDLALDMTFRLFISRDGYQTIRLFANDRLVDEQRFYGHGIAHEASFVIPRDAVSEEGELILVFHYPDAVTPISLGMNHDSQFYSIEFLTIQITETGTE